MGLDRASTQKMVAKLGFTLSFIFLLAVIALAFA
jgi:hypothetical protein